MRSSVLSQAGFSSAAHDAGRGQHECRQDQQPRRTAQQQVVAPEREGFHRFAAESRVEALLEFVHVEAMTLRAGVRDLDGAHQ